MGRTGLTEYLRYAYGPLEDRTTHCTDRKQDLRPAWGHRLEGSPEGTLGGVSYVFSFMFFGSIRAITETIHRWLYFLSTASV
jgi:hypothetical protein